MESAVLLPELGHLWLGIDFDVGPTREPETFHTHMERIRIQLEGRDMLRYSYYLMLANLATLTLFSSLALGQNRTSNSNAFAFSSTDAPANDLQLAQATFGGGCFWCTEAVFQRVKGVKSVLSGYMGGLVPNPTYEMVKTMQTGHAEVIHITYDPKEVAYEKLLEIFWKTHDPTTKNQQGPDHGPQYRSAVFYHDLEQKNLAEKYKQLLEESGAFHRPIVTEITQASVFYPAENYHQNYYNQNKSRDPYCRQIQIKLAKFRKVFPEEIDKQKDKVK